MIDFKKIKCIAYDFDGVMTDNRVLISEDGNEFVFVNRGDGYAISKIKEIGIRQVIISTEQNHVVKARAKKLGIEVYYGVEDKGAILLNYCKKYNIQIKNVLYIGNDLNDLPAFEISGYKGAPKDAEPEIIKKADWISEKKGGYGVIRDLYEIIIK